MGCEDEEERFVLKQVVENGALYIWRIGVLAQLIDSKAGEGEKLVQALRILRQEG